MKVFKRTLSDELESVELLAFADWHNGDPLCDLKRVKEDIEYVRTHENAYCVLNGDLMNCAIKTAISDCYSERYTPMDELAMCVELLGCISDKIICVVPGNHENRHYKTNGIDITRLMCQQLGIEDRYSPTTAYVYLRFGRDECSSNRHRPILYTVYVTHGNANGRKDGGKIQRLADYATICDADVYIAGHSHLEAGFKKGFHRPNPGNNSVTKVLHLFVNTSAKLDYDGGYGDGGGFDPPWNDTPIIFLSGTKKDMRVSI